MEKTEKGLVERVKDVEETLNKMDSTASFNERLEHSNVIDLVTESREFERCVESEVENQLEDKIQSALDDVDFESKIETAIENHDFTDANDVLRSEFHDAMTSRTVVDDLKQNYHFKKFVREIVGDVKVGVDPTLLQRIERIEAVLFGSAVNEESENAAARLCTTCKYLDSSLGDEPCRSCVNTYPRASWEPKVA